ncbi:hypothetical protein ACWC9T_38235 [Kitasatospora sp. NPDC001159]
MVSPQFTTGPVAPATAPGRTGGTNEGPAPGRLVLAGGAGRPPSHPAPGPVTTRLDTPYELGASAGAARQIATDLNSTNGKAGAGAHSLTEYASTAATKVRGFAFGGALTDSTERWLQQCTALHDRLDFAAANLDRSQQGYRTNETATAANLTAGA